MDRRHKVELFQMIRRDYAAGEAILGLAKKHGLHRRMVRQAISSAIHRKKISSPQAPQTGSGEGSDRPDALASRPERSPQARPRLIASGLVCGKNIPGRHSLNQINCPAIGGKTPPRNGVQQTRSIRAAEI